MPLLPSFFFFSMKPHPPSSTLFPYTTLFRSPHDELGRLAETINHLLKSVDAAVVRSEEHTSELRHTVISYAVFCLKKKNFEAYPLLLFSFVQFDPSGGSIFPATWSAMLVARA